jgi:hypothetical protein
MSRARASASAGSVARRCRTSSSAAVTSSEGFVLTQKPFEFCGNALRLKNEAPVSSTISRGWVKPGAGFLIQQLVAACECGPPGRSLLHFIKQNRHRPLYAGDPFSFSPVAKLGRPDAIAPGDDDVWNFK